MQKDTVKDKPGVIIIEGIHYETGKQVNIAIQEGFIISVTDTQNTKAESQNLFVAPGLIDNQINGYRGTDFSDGTLTTEKMKKAIEFIWSDGATSFLPTIITNSHDNLVKNFRNLADTLKDELIRESVPGFHLEGPYISPEEGYYGCHPVLHIRKPSWNEFIEYQESASGNIVQITLSPELEGAPEFIELCTQNGITVGLGHTNASSEQINIAVEKGARISTHLGNGCANLINRHSNPLWPQLANDLLTPSIIADGHHLPQDVIQVFYKVKGPHNLILTSDVNHLIGMPSGNYVYLGSEVVYTEDGLIKNPKLNCLAGASMPLRKGVETMMNYTGCSLGEAINFASQNVARINNLNDRGLLAPGKRADLILFEKEGNKLLIKQTWLKGRLVFNST